MPEPIHPDQLKPHFPAEAGKEAWRTTSVAAHEGAETLPFEQCESSTIAIGTTGQLFLTGGAILKPGYPYRTISFMTGGTAAGVPLNQWFCAVRLSDRAVLAKTADDTTTAWGTFAIKSLSFASDLYVSELTPIYLGIVVVATTVPTVIGKPTFGAGVPALPPIQHGSSTGALTNPASLGAVAGAVSVLNRRPWAGIV